MDSSDCEPHLLRSLLVFKNTINQELIRSLHVYRLDEGKENEVEREFVLSANEPYVELPADPLLRLMKFPVSQVHEGHVNGCWVCIFAFDRVVGFLIELIRSLHVYRLDEGKENEVEREFVLSANEPYVELPADPLLRLMKFPVSQVHEGHVNGCWVCIFAFQANCPPNFTCIPSILSVSRNRKLKSIPALANDLQMIFELSNKKPLQRSGEETCQGSNDNNHQLIRSSPVLDLDLNSLPCPVPMSESSEDQEIGRSLPGIMEKKKKRAPSEHVANIALSDLAKYFDLPIVEASRNLNVGLTVLKKKCREFGIPRWPHRKIKSLDGLIRDLQEETEIQQQENQAAALAVAKRQRMLENEKESIERKPFLEMKTETKKFRQDVFKRRHRARLLRSQGLSNSDN